QMRIEMRVQHFDATLVTIDAQTQLVDVPGCPAARMNDAEGTAAEGCRHDEAVVGIEVVLANLVPFRLGERAQTTRHILYAGRSAKGDEVKNVDADIAQHAVRAVALRQAPKPLRSSAPVAPGLR